MYNKYYLLYLVHFYIIERIEYINIINFYLYNSMYKYDTNIDLCRMMKCVCTRIYLKNKNNH